MRKEHDTAAERVTEITAELATLVTASDELATLEPQADGLADAEARLRTTEAVVAARRAFDAVPVVDEPARPDEAACDAAAPWPRRGRRAAAELDGELGGPRPSSTGPARP